MIGLPTKPLSAEARDRLLAHAALTRLARRYATEDLALRAELVGLESECQALRETRLRALQDSMHGVAEHTLRRLMELEEIIEGVSRELSDVRHARLGVDEERRVLSRRSLRSAQSS